MTEKKLKERKCRMCGNELPPFNRYPTYWCWICWRNMWECDHHRYYVQRPNKERGITYWEEVQSLRGIFAFSEENKPLIEKEMKKARKKLMEESLLSQQRNSAIKLEF